MAVYHPSCWNNPFVYARLHSEMRYINGDSGDLPNAKIFPLRDGETSTCDLLLRFEPAFQAGQNKSITHGLRSPACTFRPITSIHFLI